MGDAVLNERIAEKTGGGDGRLDALAYGDTSASPGSGGTICWR